MEGSRSIKMTIVVPRGSVLGPLLSLIYLNMSGLESYLSMSEAKLDSYLSMSAARLESYLSMSADEAKVMSGMWCSGL